MARRIADLRRGGEGLTEDVVTGLSRSLICYSSRSVTCVMRAILLCRVFAGRSRGYVWNLRLQSMLLVGRFNWWTPRPLLICGGTYNRNFTRKRFSIAGD